jgi:hypothetical protein
MPVPVPGGQMRRGAPPGMVAGPGPAVAERHGFPAATPVGPPRFAPPRPLPERPQSRPGFVWAPGYHDWRNDHYEWVPGHLESERLGYTWIEPRYELQGGVFVSIPGGWLDLQAQPAAPPPPPVAEPIGEARPGFIWLPGYQDWRDGRYVWIAGHWEPERPQERWHPGRWERHGNHWMWRPGRWHHH